MSHKKLIKNAPLKGTDRGSNRARKNKTVTQAAISLSYKASEGVMVFIVTMLLMSILPLSFWLLAKALF